MSDSNGFHRVEMPKTDLGFQLVSQPRPGSMVVNKEQYERQAFVANLTLLRQQVFKRLIDPRRDIDGECGYPNVLRIDDYKLLYEREGVATRTVSLLPEESWSLDPDVYEDEDESTETEFETKVKELQDTHNLWATCQTADEVSGIGRYGVILLGIDDGKKLSDPVRKGYCTKDEAPGSGRELLFMRCFDEKLLQITKFDNDKKSPRYGMPIEYNVTLYDITDDPPLGTGTNGPVMTTEPVHWTRVIHIADNCKTSKVFGIPRMKPVFNRLADIRKTMGASGEMFWRGAIPGLSIEAMPQAIEAGILLDPDAVKEEVASYSNSLQRYMAFVGMTAKSLAPQVSDPTTHIQIHLNAIAIHFGCPLRKFMGSEQAQLASGQDDTVWNKRVDRRRQKYLSPCIIRPLIDRLIWIGVIPAPADDYEIDWPDLNTPSDKDKAAVFSQRMAAFASYVSGGVEQLIPPQEMFTHEAGYTKEEAEAIIDAGEEHQVEMLDQQMTEFGQQQDTLVPFGADIQSQQQQQQDQQDQEFALKKEQIKASAKKKATTNSEGKQKIPFVGNAWSSGPTKPKTDAKGKKKKPTIEDAAADPKAVLDEYAKTVAKHHVLQQKVKHFTVKLPRDMVDNKWSDESRAAALEARRRHKKPSAFPDTLTGIKVIKSLGGSTGAKLVEYNGQQFVMKRGNSKGHLLEEYDAIAAYRALGVPVPDAAIYDEDGPRPAILTKLVEGQSLHSFLTSSNPATARLAVKSISKHFVADAVLGNWDVVGLSMDNIIVDPAGTPVRVDVGGSLRYRAQGAMKSLSQFGGEVGEIGSLRDKKLNPQASKVFASLSEAEIKRQVMEVWSKRHEVAAVLPPETRHKVTARIESLYRKMWGAGGVINALCELDELTTNAKWRVTGAPGGAKFTGMITDSLGRHYYFVDGKRVPREQKPEIKKYVKKPKEEEKKEPSAVVLAQGILEDVSGIEDMEAQTEAITLAVKEQPVHLQAKIWEVIGSELGEGVDVSAHVDAAKIEAIVQAPDDPPLPVKEKPLLHDYTRAGAAAGQSIWDTLHAKDLLPDSDNWDSAAAALYTDTIKDKGLKQAIAKWLDDKKADWIQSVTDSMNETPTTTPKLPSDVALAKLAALPGIKNSNYKLSPIAKEMSAGIRWDIQKTVLPGFGSKLWKTESVDLSKVRTVFTARILETETAKMIKNGTSSAAPILMIKKNDIHYLVVGAHQAAAARLLGQDTVVARVYNLADKSLLVGDEELGATKAAAVARIYEAESPKLKAKLGVKGVKTKGAAGTTISGQTKKDKPPFVHTNVSTVEGPPNADGVVKLKTGSSYTYVNAQIATGQNIDDDHYKWDQHYYGDIASRVPKKSFAALKGYTNGSYFEVNNTLRKYKEAFDHTKSPESTTKHIKALDAAFAEYAGSVPEDILVFRSMGTVGFHNWVGKVGEEIKPGSVIKDHGFVSTSSSSHRNAGYSCEILLPKGSTAISVKGISTHPSENEIMLPRGAEFDVIAVRQHHINKHPIYTLRYRLTQEKKVADVG